MTLLHSQMCDIIMRIGAYMKICFGLTPLVAVGCLLLGVTQMSGDEAKMDVAFDSSVGDVRI